MNTADRFRIVVFWFFLVPGLLAQDEGLSKGTMVWAFDDTVKVSPLTGETLGFNAPQSKDFRRSNSVWDAATSTVKLFAGRNEFVSFQIAIEKQAQDVRKVFVNATDLIGSQDRISADSHIKMFKQLYMEHRGVWYPDALLPFDLAAATLLDLPDPKTTLGDRQRVQSVWVDIYVPH